MTEKNPTKNNPDSVRGCSKNRESSLCRGKHFQLSECGPEPNADLEPSVHLQEVPTESATLFKP